MNSEFKTVIAFVLIGIVASLGKALFHMSSSPEQSAQMVRALTVRISLSIALFVFLLVAWYAGLIEPHGLR
ncbi:MAG TPA: DUF2909 domain-containing protein [Steroidobacteraceae bacterium]|nr:DUF2909 domain-containing protein [Steroidobacteraceae bacterium]